MAITEKQKNLYTAKLHKIYEGLSDRELLERQTYYQFQMTNKIQSINSMMIFFTILIILNILGLLWFAGKL